MFPSFHPHSPLIINMSDWPKAACSKVCGTKQHEQKKKKKKKKNGGEKKTNLPYSFKIKFLYEINFKMNSHYF